MQTLSRRTLLTALSLATPIWAKKKKKKNKKGRQDPNLGLLTGTVFQASGLSLPGAKVTATSTLDPKVEFEIFSDGRGEFTFRAPAGVEPGSAQRYKVRAEAKGFQAAEKEADVYLGQRTNINLILSPDES